MPRARGDFHNGAAATRAVQKVIELGFLNTSDRNKIMSIQGVWFETMAVRRNDQNVNFLRGYLARHVAQHWHAKCGIDAIWASKALQISWEEFVQKPTASYDEVYGRPDGPQRQCNRVH